MTIDANTLPLVAGDGPAALAEQSPDWLATLRRAAIARYGQVGLPGPRTEAWKFTGLNPLKALQPVPAAVEAAVALPAVLQALDSTGIRIVNGRLDAVPTDLPQGVEVASLDGPSAVPDWVRANLGGVV